MPSSYHRFRQLIQHLKLDATLGHQLSTLANHQFSISTIEHIGAKEFKERYIKPIDLKMDVIEIERVILAEIK